MAKHGNRNLSSKSGAADALTELGLNVMVGPEVVERCLTEAGIGFMMAPMHHPAIRHVMPVRPSLARARSSTSSAPDYPAGVKRQLTGAFSAQLIRPMAETLLALGSEKAWLVHGSDGTDEISICGATSVSAVEGGAVRDFTLHPEDAGLSPHPFDAILAARLPKTRSPSARSLTGLPGPIGTRSSERRRGPRCRRQGQYPG